MPESTENNGKTLRAPAGAKPETIWSLIASKWWDRTDGGRKKNRFLTIPCHVDGDEKKKIEPRIVVGKYTEPDGVPQISLMEEFFQKPVPSADKPSF